MITIDGYSSCGKSTLAKDLAKALNYKYVDTGAMYRAVTLYFLENEVNPDSKQAVEDALNHISIDFSYAPNSGEQVTFLNGQEVEEAIRSFRVSANVSEISAIREVREKMVEQQQNFGKEKGIVMDGRDIGTVVFPKAEFKIFLTASQPVRIKRRYDELKQKGKIVSIEDVRRDLEERDFLDANRSESPLRKAVDAVILDNTHLSIAEQKAWAYEKAMEIICK